MCTESKSGSSIGGSSHHTSMSSGTAAISVPGRLGGGSSGYGYGYGHAAGGVMGLTRTSAVAAPSLSCEEFLVRDAYGSEWVLQSCASALPCPGCGQVVVDRH